MSRLTDALYEGWHQLFKALAAEDRQQLPEVLPGEYIDEAQDMAQFTERVKSMPYPLFRDSLRRIIAEEEAHVKWLREHILALHGEIPIFSPAPRAGKNTGERLLMDLEAEKRSYEVPVERVYLAERSDAQVAEGLCGMREDERRHRDAILDLLIKIDPYSLSPGPEHGEAAAGANA